MCLLWTCSQYEPHPQCITCYEVLANENQTNNLQLNLETKHFGLTDKPLEFFQYNLTKLNGQKSTMSTLKSTSRHFILRVFALKSKGESDSTREEFLLQARCTKNWFQ